jgi:glycosyltransferase involved in cell wall biosynthesis
MRICYIADGSSVHTRDWLNYISARGHEVHLICWKLSPGLHKNLRIHVLQRRLTGMWEVSQYINFAMWSWQIRRLVASIQPDVLDGHFVSTYGFLAACTGFRPLVVTAWGSDVLVFPRHNPIYRFTARYAMSKADVVVCTAAGVKQGIAELGIDAAKIRIVVLGGVNREKFNPVERDTRFLVRAGISEGGPVVISVRALAPVYDLATLVKAVPIVLGKVPSARFIIAGEGEQESYLKRLAADLGILNRVFFTGWIEHELLPVYLSASDIYVSTALSDGASNGLLEAMACELAPVVCDIPANRQWIDESVNGFLFSAGDHVCLAEKIISLLNDRELKIRFGRRNREIVTVKADTESEMRKLEDIYAAVSSGRRES